MKKKPGNLAASYRAKLLSLAHSRGEDFQFVLGRWIIERFLYRLSGSKHKHDLVLKGAMLFLAWDGKFYRPTKDLDLLGFGSANVNDVATRVRDICAEPADDGVVFNLDGIEAERIKEDAEYEGVRLQSNPQDGPSPFADGNFVPFRYQPPRDWGSPASGLAEPKAIEPPVLREITNGRALHKPSERPHPSGIRVGIQ